LAAQDEKVRRPVLTDVVGLQFDEVTRPDALQADAVRVGEDIETPEIIHGR